MSAARPVRPATPLETPPLVPLARRRHLLEQARAGLGHDAALRMVPEIDGLVLAGFPEERGPAPCSLRVGAWNVQHCHFPEESGRLLASCGLDLVLLSELDIGMRRTAQVNTPAALAKAQAHGYAFATEFLELRSPDGVLPGTIGGPENEHGLHGNGLTAARPPREAVLIRLRPEADWFVAPRRDQHRVGTRMALAASFALGRGEVVVVSVHLESDTDRAGRARQMEELLAAVDRFAGKRPVLIGGDLNAGARSPGLDHRGEALFEVAASFGYAWEGCNLDRPTSRRSRVTNAVQQATAHYDWFLARGLRVEAPAVVAAVDEAGQPLSDHEIITVTIRADPEHRQA